MQNERTVSLGLGLGPPHSDKGAPTIRWKGIKGSVNLTRCLVFTCHCCLFIM